MLGICWKITVNTLTLTRVEIIRNCSEQEALPPYCTLAQWHVTLSQAVGRDPWFFITTPPTATWTSNQVSNREIAMYLMIWPWKQCIITSAMSYCPHSPFLMECGSWGHRWGHKRVPCWKISRNHLVNNGSWNSFGWVACPASMWWFSCYLIIFCFAMLKNKIEQISHC